MSVVHCAYINPNQRVTKAVNVAVFLSTLFLHFLDDRIRISEILPGIENLILPVLSYPGYHVNATYVSCIRTHVHGRQVTSLLF